MAVATAPAATSAAVALAERGALVVGIGSASATTVFVAAAPVALTPTLSTALSAATAGVVAAPVLAAPVVAARTVAPGAPAGAIGPVWALAPGADPGR